MTEDEAQQWVCTICLSENVEEVDELVPSGMRHQIRCENGHVTYGVPAVRNTSL